MRNTNLCLYSYISRIKIMKWANIRDSSAAGVVGNPYLLTLALVPLLTVAAVLLQKWLSRVRLPPGTRLPPTPPARSIRGHAEVVSFGFHRKKALEWAKQFGPVIRRVASALSGWRQVSGLRATYFYKLNKHRFTISQIFPIFRCNDFRCGASFARG